MSAQILGNSELLASNYAVLIKFKLIFGVDLADLAELIYIFIIWASTYLDVKVRVDTVLCDQFSVCTQNLTPLALRA